MKNLKLLYEQSCQIEANCKYFAFDNEAAKFYVAGKDFVKGYLADGFQECFYINLSTHSFFENNRSSLNIVGLEYLCGEEQVCIALQNGDILLCGTVDHQVEAVGTLECEIMCMSWSPDQEIVLFVTNAGSAVAMNHDFDPISELEIVTGSFGDGGFVDVGWGSKETQFQGSAGKIVPGKEKNQESAETLYDDNETKVIWRGDGHYFAINTRENSQRKFRVWNRTCELQYTSEDLPGLESCFCWKPSGSLIATSQRKVHRHDIVFFELNGLQHGEFTLPFRQDQMHLKKLEWNCDSSILALSAIDVQTKQNYLQLWTISNYHWSLKQSLELLHEVALFFWDVEQPFHLHVVSQSGLYTLYHWSSCIDSSKLTCINNQGNESLNSSCVGVIDGAKVKITPFKVVVIPPPMCAFQIQFKKTVKLVCFLEDAAQPVSLGVLLNDGTFITFVNENNDVKYDDVKVELMVAGGNGYTSLVTPFSIDKVFKPKMSDFVSFKWWRSSRHLVWHNNGTLSAVAYFEDTDFLLSLSLGGSNSEYSCTKSLSLESNVVSLCAAEQPGNLIVQLKSGKVLAFMDNALRPFIDFAGAHVNYGFPCPEMQLCKFAHESSEKDQYGLVALSHHRKLFLNNILISAECTSFYLHQEYIIYSTFSHKLHFVPKLFSILEKPKIEESHSSLKDSKLNAISRSVERGARIVAVTPFDTKVMLQLPRGNLEILHPRPLLISLIKHDLNHGLYRHAFVIMRKHRINMNLIHDHNSKLFFDKIDLFIKELDSVEYINLFLSELQENDITVTMYSQFYPLEVPASKSLLAKVDSKIEKICNAVLVRLLDLDSVKYFLSILTAYVRKPSPQIEQALHCLKTMKQKQILHDNLVNDALRHLYVMVDGRILFQEALATYDLDLTLTVAQVSNNDPKEYVPFLNELKSLEENYKRYKIDMHLKKYSRALLNISNCPEHFSECIELIKAQKLHREALTLFKRYTPQYREVSNSYAEVLTGDHKYEEAGIILARCDNLKRAIKCFTTGGCWQQALNSANALQYTAASYLELAKTLAENLVMKNKYLDAAIILEEVQDFDGAICSLLKGKLWSYALRLINLHKMKDLIDTQVIPALEESCNDMKTSLESYREQFNKHYTRLLVVREIKHEKALQALTCGDSIGNDLESDIVSDFGSTLTGSSRSSVNSRMSQKSAKSRRKQERKRFTLREGSRFEEEGLLQALHELFGKLKAVEEDIRSLLLHLVLFHLDTEASQLQNLYQSTHQIFSQNKSKIWVLPDPDSDSLIGGAQSTVNSIIASRSIATGSKCSFEDLEVRVPPKFSSSEKTGLHLYLNKTKH